MKALQFVLNIILLISSLSLLVNLVSVHALTSSSSYQRNTFEKQKLYLSPTSERRIRSITQLDDTKKGATPPPPPSSSNNQSNRRNFLATTTAGALLATTGGYNANAAVAATDEDISNLEYVQRFPSLFAPLYGKDTRKTIKRQLAPNLFSLEQNLELGPLQTPIRCVVIKLQDGNLWVHSPLAPTQEFFDLVESCCDGDGSKVAHIVVPTYALEHKIFVKDSIERWPNAKLWTCPGQFTFPFKVSEEFVFGKAIDGVLTTSATSSSSTTSQALPSWSDEIEYETLAAGTFDIGTGSQTFFETSFYHKSTKSLIVTDSVVRIPRTVPPLNDPEKLLLVSKRSTSDPQPVDTPESRLIGWEKTALLVSYFFPEHEEPDPNKPGVVTWTDGWHDNFQYLSGRLICPPVVRTLIYRQNPRRVQQWVDNVTTRFDDFQQIIPAHFDAPIPAKPADLQKAFWFLQDDTIDAFPQNDLARGLQPIADIALKRLQ